MRRHQRLKRVAGADGDEFSRLRGEQLGDGAGVLSSERHAGQDQRAGIDGLRRQPGRLILPRDEVAERRRIDVLALKIGRQQDVGLVNDAAFNDEIARIEALQHYLGEQQMRGRRADIDADTGQLDLVLLNQAAAGIGEENPPALLVFKGLADRFVACHWPSGFS